MSQGNDELVLEFFWGGKCQILMGGKSNDFIGVKRLKFKFQSVI